MLAAYSSQILSQSDFQINLIIFLQASHIQAEGNHTLTAPNSDALDVPLLFALMAVLGDLALLLHTAGTDVAVVPGLAVRMIKLLNLSVSLELARTGPCSTRAFSSVNCHMSTCFVSIYLLMLTDSPYSPFGVTSLNKTNGLSFSLPCSFKIFIMLLFLSSYSSTCPEQFKMEEIDSRNE